MNFWKFKWPFRFERLYLHWIKLWVIRRQTQGNYAIFFKNFFDVVYFGGIQHRGDNVPQLRYCATFWYLNIFFGKPLKQLWLSPIIFSRFFGNVVSLKVWLNQYKCPNINNPLKNRVWKDCNSFEFWHCTKYVHTTVWKNEKFTITNI